MLYNFIIRIYTLAIRIAARFNAKAQKWVQGRKGWHRALKQYPRPAGSLIWFHCASLGEFEQGRPIIEHLKQTHPQICILLTFFSPSGYQIRKNYQFADQVWYLPPDTPANARFFISHFRPDMAVFVKYEFWRNYLKTLHSYNIPVFSISALFRHGQLFFRPWGKWYRRILHYFTHIFTQDSASVELLQKYGINHCTVSGDTRFDRVAAIAKNPRPVPVIEAFGKGYLLMVAGSTWPEDETLLAQTLPETGNRIKTVLAPHEIGENHLKTIEKQLADVAVARFSQINNSNATAYSVLLVDNIGMLSAIYAYADFAYVGGAFRTGLHNILEPAAFGIPVIFGPKYSKFREAHELIKQGGAISIRTSSELATVVKQFVNNTEYRKKQGEISRKYIEAKKGATTVIANRLRQYLTRTSHNRINDKIKTGV